MNKTIRFYLLGLSLLCLGGLLLLSCESWDLPGRKTKRDCGVKPAGNLEAVVQQKQVTFSISNTAGTIDQVNWDFGNGSTTVTTGMTATYTYPTSSTYTVKATLSNTCLDETNLLRTITVSDVMLPTVTLQAITAVSITSATAGMTITSTGNATIARYGICYSATNLTPEESTDPKEERIGAATINTPLSFTLQNLQPNTLYYARSYAVNSTGKPGYSAVQVFRTGQNPAVTINGTPNTGTTTATLNLVVSTPGNPAATIYGVCYASTTNLPDPGSNPKVEVTNPTVGANTVINLTNLNPKTTYYYRPYAKSASGEIIYGAVGSFTTLLDAVTQDLIASVSFTDGSYTDISGYNNHAIPVNNPVFTADRKGQPNSAIQLNGASNYFYMAENASLRPDAMSISVWIKPVEIKNVNNRVQIYNKSQWNDGSGEMYSSLIKPSETGPGLTFMTDIKQNSGCQGGKGWQNVQFSSSFQLNTWHHLVFTYAGRSGRMYFDNVLLGQRDDLPANTIDNCAGGELKFGAQLKDYPNFFNGAMDDIRIYKRALTAAEVQTLFNQ